MKVAYDIALESMKGNPEALLPKFVDNGWYYLCPAHHYPDYVGYIADNKKGHGAPTLRCGNGCTSRDIEKALRKKGLWFWDKKKDEPGDENLERRFNSAYVYTSRQEKEADREVVARVVNWDYVDDQGEIVKTETVFQQPDKKGAWISAPPDMAVPPYNWLNVRMKAFSGSIVFNVEGEEAVDLLAEWSLVGFTTFNSINNHRGIISSAAALDCNGVEYVAIIPEMSQNGMLSARRKARFLHELKIACKIVALPGLKAIPKDKAASGEGLKQWILKGHTVDELKALVKGAPFWPTAEDEEMEVSDPFPVRTPKPEEIAPVSNLVLSENDPFNYVFTDLGLALWFKKIYKDSVAYLPTAKTWIIYKDGIWKYDKAKTVRNLMARAADVMKKEMLAAGRYSVEKINEWRDNSLSTRSTNAALTLAESRMHIDDTMFNTSTWKIPCKNGVVCLQTGELLPHDPSYKWTKCLNFEYQPEVGWEQAPVFDGFMCSIFPDEVRKRQREKIHSVIRCFAIALTGDPKFRKWFMLWGPNGREGKSTKAELVLELMGDFGCTAKKYLITETAQDNKFTDPGALKEERFVLMDEIGKRDKIDNEKMKSVSGNDSITGSKLFENTFTFKPTHYLYVYGNSKPRFDAGGDTAAQDRCVVIPFLRHFEEHEQDDTLADRIKAELQAIFTIFVFACCHIWRAKSLDIHQFMIDAKNDYMAEEDIFGQFLEQCIGPATTNLTAEELHDCWVWWCRSEQGIPKPWAKNVIGREMGRRGFKSINDADGYRIYENLAVKPSCLVRQRTYKTKANVDHFNLN